AVDAAAHLQALDAERIGPGVGRAHAALGRVDLGLVPELADRGDLRILAVAAVLGRVTHGLVGAVGVEQQAAAEQVVVAVLQVDLVEVVELRAGAERGAAHHGVGDVVGAVAVHAGVVALALEVEAGDGGLQPLQVVLAEVQAELQEQVVGLGVVDRARAAHADRAPVAVVGRAASGERGRHQHVVVVLAVAEGHADLPAVAVVVALGGPARGQRGFGAAHRALGDVVDDAACGADALGGRRAVDDLDAVDDAQVGEAAGAVGLAQRRGLRYADEQAQRDAAAQRLARVEIGRAHV